VGSVIRVRLDDGGQVITSPVDRTERHLDVALDPRHSRWMAWLLATESQLVEPVSEWADQPILFNDALETATTEPFGLGQDCYADVIFDDVVGDDFVDEPPYSGVQALAEVTQLGMFTVPDPFFIMVSLRIGRSAKNRPTTGGPETWCRDQPAAMR